MKRYPKEFLELCRSITAKRPRAVIDHILKHGSVTTDELTRLYGYSHAPRAARDVREHGIALETFRVEGPNNRKIASYRFADPSAKPMRKLEGRTGLSRKIKAELVDKYGAKCFIYLETTKVGELQLDHRVPFEVGGDNADPASDDFMLLSPSANRAKSWSCEHCENWKNFKKKQICLSCYWAYPENYDHIAMTQMRRVDLLWQGEEIASYEKLKVDARAAKQTMPQYVKEVIKKAVGQGLKQ